MFEKQSFFFPTSIDFVACPGGDCYETSDASSAGTLPAINVPEPASATLLTLALLTIVSNRRRRHEGRRWRPA
jgi:hypothetical protein